MSTSTKPYTGDRNQCKKRQANNNNKGIKTGKEKN